MNKRIIIVGGLIVALSLTAGIILLVNRNGSEVTEQTDEPVGINSVTDTQVFSAIPSHDRSVLWYFDDNARLYRIDPSNQSQSEFPLPAIPSSSSLKQVAWPVTGNDFMVVSSKAGTREAHHYSNTTKSYTSWPTNIQSFSWLPDGRRIVYVWQSGDNTSQQLVMANADTTGFRVIADVFWPDLAVKASPDGEEVLLVRTKPEGVTNKIYKVNITTGRFETVIGEGKNLDALWLPSTDRFLFTREGVDGSTMVALYDMNTGLANDLRLETSLNKIYVDDTGTVLYAAIPIQDGIGDKFVKVDLITFQQEDYFVPPDPLTAENLFFVNGDLYFINSLDQKLYSIEK